MTTQEETTRDVRDKCPICGRDYVMRCRCMTSDMMCEMGHEWHTCTVHNRVVIGPSDHSVSDHVCTCNSNTSTVRLS